MTVPIARLGDVADIERDGVHPNDISNGAAYLGLEHIESGGRILGAVDVANGDLASTKFKFTSEHVLYGKLRPYLAKIALPDFDGICSTDIVPVRPGAALDKRYLAYFLRQPAMVDFASSRATGANLPRLSPKALADFEIPLPPLEEQKRIAAILDQADALRRLRRRALDRHNTLGQAIFHEMFGDLIKNPDRLPFVRVQDVISGFETGKNIAEDPNLSIEGRYRILKVSAVTSGTFKADESKPLPPNYEPRSSHFVRSGDLLFSRANTEQLIGATAVVGEAPSGLVLPDKLWRFVWKQPAGIDPVFMHGLFASTGFRDEIRKRSSGTSGSMKNIGQGKVLDIAFGMPDQSNQLQYANRVNAFGRSVGALKREVAIIDSLFTSLQHRAFRGEL